MNETLKQIDIKNFFVTDHVEQCDIDLEYTPTVDMIADTQTKISPARKHKAFSYELLMLRCREVGSRGVFRFFSFTTAFVKS